MGERMRLIDLTDVNISNPSDGEVLTYDSATQKWTNQAASAYTAPLDLVPGATVGYSTARALSAAMLGQDAYTLRRDSDDAELAFAFDATTGEIDAAAVTTWKGGGDAFFKQFNDHSGNNKNFVQATNMEQPPWAASTINSKPGIDASGNGVCMETSATINYGGEWTIFIVAKYSSVEFNQFGVILGINGGSGVDWFSADNQQSGGGGMGSEGKFGALVYPSGGAYAECYTQNSVQSTLEDAFLGEIVFSASEDGQVLLNGVSQTVTNDRDGVFAAFDANLGLLSNSPDGGGGFWGLFCELLIYPSLLSSGDRTTIRQNIATYYNITLP